jgi:hypothetical protein
MIARTTNGGANWVPLGESGLVIGTIRDLHWFSLNEGLIVGDSRVQRTTSGGASWQVVSTTVGYDAIDFFDVSRGVASAFAHDVGVTTDGGATWTRIAVPMDGFISDVAAVGDDFYALGGSNAIVGGDQDGPPVAAGEISPPQSAAFDLVIWPNPLRAGVARFLHFGWRDAAIAAPMEARLYDVSGRLLVRERIPVGARERSLSLEGVKLLPGVVFLQVHSEGGRVVSGKATVVR